jgi:WD40 repeat protein/tRNA A-37 threonylcarbamoyl transferase component Bud32
MSHEPNEPSPRGERVNAIIADYLRAADSGQAPSRQELLKRHPDLVTELQAFFADHDELNQLAQPLRNPAETSRPQEDHLPQRSSATEAPTLGLGESGSTDLGQRVRYFGDYELLSEIARGGMGVVYKARQSNLNRVVALKMILAGQFASPADVQRFLTEAEAAANLDHANIVSIYEVGEHDGQHYFSMRLVEGGSLAQWIFECRPSLIDSPDGGAMKRLQRDSAQLIVSVARAVHHAHQRGVLHRDLKPANILLQNPQSPIRDLQSAVALVTDFGLAKRATGPGGHAGDVNLTRSGAILGTPSYMAPEQASGTKGLTTAVDVYSLGAILYELLTGRPPFQADTPLDTVLQVLEQEPQRPRQLDARVDRDLETVCLKCLEKDPSRRYATAEDLALDLERWLAGEPILARRASRWERARKWARRRPAAAALATVSAASLLCLLALAAFLWHNAELRAEAVQDLEAARREQKAASQEAATQQELAQAKRTEVERLEQVAQQERQKAGAAQETARRLLYAADMQFAHAAWATENMQRMVPLLERYRQVGPDQNLRGFEWHYLWRLSHAERFTLRAHAEPRKQATDTGDRAITEYPVLLALTPDGKTVASTSRDNQIKLWDVTTGKELRVLPSPGSVVSLAFGEGGTSLILVTSKPRKPGHVDDPKLLMEILGGKGKPTLDPLTDALELRILEFDGRKPPAVTKLNPTRLAAPVNFFAVATDGEGKIPTNLIPLKEGLFVPMCLALAPDKKVLALGGIITELRKPGTVAIAPKQDGAILLWDLDKGEEVALLKARSFVQSMAFAPDGTTLAGTNFDKSIRLWSLARQMDGKLMTLETATLTAQASVVPALAFSADSKTLITGAGDGNVKLWDVASKQVRLECKGHLQGVMSVVVTPDSKTLLTGSMDGLIKVWDINRLGGPIAVPDHKTVKALAFSSDGQTLTSLDQAGVLRVTDVATGKATSIFRLETKPVHVSAGAVTPDGQAVVAQNILDRSIKLYDTSAGRERYTIGDKEGFIDALAFTPDGKTLAMGTFQSGNDGAVKLWDVATGKEKQTLPGNTKRTKCVAFSSDGKTLAIAFDQSVKVWDLAAGKERVTPKVFRYDVACVAFTPDGHRLVAAAGDTIMFWDMDRGRETLIINAYGHEPTTMAFSPDGTRLVTGGKEGKLAKGGGVKVWDTRTGYELLTLGGTSDAISCVAFSSDGRRLATAATSGGMSILVQGTAHVTIWDATSPDRQP